MFTLWGPTSPKTIDDHSSRCCASAGPLWFYSVICAFLVLMIHHYCQSASQGYLTLQRQTPSAPRVYCSTPLLLCVREFWIKQMLSVIWIFLLFLCINCISTFKLSLLNIHSETHPAKCAADGWVEFESRGFFSDDETFLFFFFTPAPSLWFKGTRVCSHHRNSVRICAERLTRRMMNATIPWGKVARYESERLVFVMEMNKKFNSVSDFLSFFLFFFRSNHIYN